MVLDGEVLEESAVEVDADTLGGAEFDLRDVGAVDSESDGQVGDFDSGT